jgi:hypothetical protein
MCIDTDSSTSAGQRVVKDAVAQLPLQAQAYSSTEGPLRRFVLRPSVESRSQEERSLRTTPGVLLVPLNTLRDA